MKFSMWHFTQIFQNSFNNMYKSRSEAIFYLSPKKVLEQDTFLISWDFAQIKIENGPPLNVQFIICRIKTGHSNLVSCFAPRMRALAKLFYRGESWGKLSCQRPNPRAKTWHKIWMTGLNPNYDTIPIISFKKTHKISAKNPRLLTIAGAIWLCRYRHCTPSQLWMHAPVAKELQLMTSQYHIFDRTDNLNPQWMQAVNGYLCELLGGLLCILINYIMINNENSTNLSADSLQAPQIHIVWGFLSGPRYRQWDHLLLISKP